VSGLALGDEEAAHVTAKVLGPDGQPAPDGTEVSFAATLGACDPARATVRDGVARTTFTPSGEMGEAVIQASCPFSAHELHLPLVGGSNGVTEIEWVVSDFEDEALNAQVHSYLAGSVTGTATALGEAAHSGEMGAALEYRRGGETPWFNAGVALRVPIPGVVLGLSFWAKATEPDAELRWAVYDEEGEHWNYRAPVLETGPDGWRRHGSSMIDPYFPGRNALLEYPLTFHCIYVCREPWGNAEQGTLYVDDIVARLLVANSEAERVRLGGF